jgi:excisionase family DNA binding protein
MEKLLTPEDLAEMASVPVATIYRWNYAGGGPKTIKVGRHVRYRPTDVEKWLDQRSTASAG